MSRPEPTEAGATRAERGPVWLGREAIEACGRALLGSVGAPPAHARIVIEHLSEASAMGVASHGFIRLPQYLAEIEGGAIDPSAEPEVVRASPACLQVDGRRGFGQVIGGRMVEALGPLAAEQGVAMVVGHHLGHTGRVGAYPEALARGGLIGLAVCNGAPSGHWVAPFGGRDGRISTNPMAFAWPVSGEPPVVADFSTGATAEGVIRSLVNRGELAPEGTLRGASGTPTLDPGVLYDEPRGAIQPFGGTLGYRATALGLLVEVLTTLLNGDVIDDRTRRGTDMTLLAIAPERGFAQLALGLSSHVLASPPIDPDRPVLMPGDRERGAAAAHPGRVAIDWPTWAAIEEQARRRGLAVPAILTG